MSSFKWRTMSAVSAASICILAAAQADAAYPPSRDADPHALPPHAMAGNCSATGNWFDTVGSGAGSWSKTSPIKCKVPGTWTDSFGYTWSVAAGAHRKLTGSVNYNNLAPCGEQIWQLTGKTGNNKTFTVRANNPDKSDTNCASYFGYDLTLQ